MSIRVDHAEAEIVAPDWPGAVAWGSLDLLAFAGEDTLAASSIVKVQLPEGSSRQVAWIASSPAALDEMPAPAPDLLVVVSVVLSDEVGPDLAGDCLEQTPFVQ